MHAGDRHVLSVPVHLVDERLGQNAGENPVDFTPFGRNALPSVPYGMSVGVTIASGWRFMMACSRLRYSGVSCDVTTGSSDSLMTSIFSDGSPRRRCTSAIHCSRVVPGRTRQSSPASATDGITLIFGGSPTPDRIQVTEIVDRRMALVNLFSANVPTRPFMVSSSGAAAPPWDSEPVDSQQAREPPRKPIVRILVVRLTSVPCHTLGPDLEPHHLLFGDRDTVDQTSGRKNVGASQTSFVDDEFRVELRIVIRNHPARAPRAADLLVGVGQQNHIPRQRDVLTLQAEKCDELGDAVPFHVQRAAAPYLVRFDGCAERIDCPPRSIRGHDVHVLKEQDRLAR